MGIESISDILGRTKVRDDLQIGLEEVFRNETVTFSIGVVPSAVPAHYHRVSDELYYIHSGRGAMRLGDERRDVAAGDVITIPRGTVHGLENGGTESMIIIVVTSPPFDPEKDRFAVQE